MAKQNKPKVGAGLQNLGNTCFANSVLQCLTHTAPLMDYMLTRQHSKNCRSKEFCMMCTMEVHMNMAFNKSGKVMTPYAVIDHLQHIAEHLQLGRQEDAHEFLHYVIPKMQKSCIYDDASVLSIGQTEDSNTNLVDRIFMGSLKSQVICQNCQYTSDRYEDFLDISLDINSSNTVLQALKDFVEVETLEGDNAYRCSQCNQLVTAEKRYTIDKAPNILTLSLKRFDMFTGAKLSKRVKYPNTLNVRQYTSSRSENIKYDLYGVLEHSGSACQSGHYYAYVKASDEQWYLMNDSQVAPCDNKTALNQEAYILFYKRAPTEACRPPPSKSCRRSTSPDDKTVTPPKRKATSISKDRLKKLRSSARESPVRTRAGVKRTRQDSFMECPAKRRRTDSASTSAVHQQETKAGSARTGSFRKSIAQKKKTR